MYLVCDVTRQKLKRHFASLGYRATELGSNPCQSGKSEKRNNYLVLGAGYWHEIDYMQKRVLLEVEFQFEQKFSLS